MLSIVALIFVVLKLCGFVTISWWWIAALPAAEILFYGLLLLAGSLVQRFKFNVSFREQLEYHREQWKLEKGN